MTLTGYFDDSKSDRVLVLAGYFSTSARWKTFSDQWDEFLRYPPRWPALKMSEVAAMRDDTAWEKLQWMHNCIQDSTDFAVTCTIDISLYGKACTAIGYKGPANGHHHLAMSYLMNDLLDRLQSRNLNDGLELVFDTQIDIAPLAGEAYPLYAESRRRFGARLIAPPPTFENDTVCKPLQAADFLAWWTRRKFLKSGDTSSSPDYGSPDATRSWSERPDYEKIAFQPSQREIEEKLSTSRSRFHDSDIRYFLEQPARKRYPPGFFR